MVTFLGDQNKSFCGCEQGLVCECCVWAAIERKAERDALKATLKDRNSFAAGSSGEKKKKKGSMIVEVKSSKYELGWFP